MAHPQNSPRGLMAKNRLDIGSQQLTVDDDSKGLVFGNPADSLPGDVDAGAAFTLISNSTGAAIGVNTTGTTWKYLSVTSVQPT